MNRKHATDKNVYCVADFPADRSPLSVYNTLLFLPSKVHTCSIHINIYTYIDIGT